MCILSNINSHSSSLLVIVCMEYLFPYFHLKPICVFESRVTFQIAYSWMIFKLYFANQPFDWRFKSIYI